jgi:hypothetical protein
MYFIFCEVRYSVVFIILLIVFLLITFNMLMLMLTLLFALLIYIIVNLYNKINITSHVFHDKIKVLYIQYNTSLKVTVTILLNLL